MQGILFENRTGAKVRGKDGPSFLKKKRSLGKAEILMVNAKKVMFILNVIIMFLFCLFCMVLVEPAHNHFIQYGKPGSLLPIPTQFAIEARPFLLIIPLLWIGLSCCVHTCIRAKDHLEQIQILLLFFMATVASGLLLLVFYGLAGILPYLMISTSG